MDQVDRIVSDHVSAAASSRVGVRLPLLIILGSVVLTALLYFPTTLEVIDIWSDSVRRRYTHGWVVLAVTMGLIWHDRAHLAKIPLSPPAAGWILVAIGSIVWLVGFNAALLAVTTLVLPLLVLGAIWASGGISLARRAAFPVLFLYLAFPIWEQLLGVPLQKLTAYVSLGLVQLLGIPVTLEDMVIHIPEGSFLIEERCNGLHFFIVAIGIALLQGHIHRDSLGARLLLLGLATGLALVTNWLRVTLVILAGHLTDMQHFLVRTDHYYFGWVLFACGLVLYMFVSARVPRGDGPQSLPVEHRLTATRLRVPAAIALSAAALALGPAWAFSQGVRESDRLAVRPPSLPGWSGPVVHESIWQPVFDGADEEFLVGYQNESADEIVVYSASYHFQRQGRELLASSNSLVGRLHVLVKAGGVLAAIGDAAVPVKEQVARGPDGRLILIWSLYTVDRRPNPLGLPSRLTYGLRSIVRAPTASVIAVAMECGIDCETTHDRLEVLFPQVLSTLVFSPEQSHGPERH